jgi:carboxyl-terminal processing protease
MNDNTESHVESKTAHTRSFLGVGLALILAAAAFFSGMHIGTGGSDTGPLEAGLFSIFNKTPVADSEADLTEFWRVWHLLDEKFVESTSTEQITAQDRIEGAISGLVKSYDDPYTVFLPPVEATAFDENISGEFSGVGMEVGIRDEVVTVIAPLPDTPAQKAGIVAADIIVKIDDVSTEGMGIDDAVKLIRGEKGTEVILSVYREGEIELLDISVTRDNITIPTINTELRDDVFIISLYSFNAVADSRMQEALQEYTKSGTKKLVLDLRGNPGGFLRSAVSIASFFVPAGEVVVREDFGDGSEEEVYRSQGRSLGKYAPDEMIVLIDGGSASASEILAGALAQHDIATLMGKTTFGKGSVQELVDLPNGSSLKVTIARWFTPDGTSISFEGLAPDIEIDRTPQQVIAGEDPQIEAAVQWLNGDKAVGQEIEEDEDLISQ